MKYHVIKKVTLIYCLVLILVEYHVFCSKNEKVETSKENLETETELQKATLNVDNNSSYTQHFTVQIDAGAKEFCGFIDLEKGNIMTTGYWVISADSNTGETHLISMSISNPREGIMEGTDHLDGGLIKMTIPSTGVHEICFDGSTAWNDIRKITFFVIVGNVGYDEERKESISDKSEMLKLVLKKHEANMTLQLLESLSSINRQIEMMQWGRKQESSKDMLKMEATLSMVDTKSYLYLLVMIIASFAQVFVIRSMFDVQRT